MSYRELSDYGHCAIDTDGDAVAFFCTENQRDQFIELINKDLPEDDDLRLTPCEYIDTDVTITVMGS